MRKFKIGNLGSFRATIVPASREDLDVPLLAVAVEEHARLDACNAGDNTRSPVIQHCEPVAPF